MPQNQTENIQAMEEKESHQGSISRNGMNRVAISILLKNQDELLLEDAKKAELFNSYFGHQEKNANRQRIGKAERVMITKESIRECLINLNLSCHLIKHLRD